MANLKDCLGLVQGAANLAREMVFCLLMELQLLYQFEVVDKAFILTKLRELRMIFNPPQGVTSTQLKELCFDPNEIYSYRLKENFLTQEDELRPRSRNQRCRALNQTENSLFLLWRSHREASTYKRSPSFEHTKLLSQELSQRGQDSEPKL